MLKAIEMLKNEHRVIELVLRCLDHIVQRGQQEGKLDRESAVRAIDFLHMYTEHCHHAKEEKCLFPALERHGLGGGCGPVAVMLREHELGRVYLNGLAVSVDAASAGDPNALTWFCRHARSYIQLLRDHMHKEDHCLFPAAERHLGAEGERELSATDDQAEPREGAQEAAQRYVALARQLADHLGIVELAEGDHGSQEKTEGVEHAPLPVGH
jgi:hemerythrin-like domain-containing protein